MYGRNNGRGRRVYFQQILKSMYLLLKYNSAAAAPQ